VRGDLRVVAELDQLRRFREILRHQLAQLLERR
jgi:hypothetical protein